MKSSLVYFLGATILVGGYVPSASAEMNSKAIEVTGRILGFVQDMPTGNLTVSIVFDPGSAQSKREADDLVQLMSSGFTVGKFVLNSKLVPVSDLSNMTGTKLAIVTTGMSDKHDQVFAETRTRGILSISSDMACVASGKCVLGVSVSPKVEIILNASAGQSSNIGFAQALRMLVREV